MIRLRPLICWVIFFMIDYSKNYSLESLFYINENGLVCQEEWKPVVGYESKYYVSDLGRVKTFNYRRNPFICKQEKINSGYNRVSLSANNKRKRMLVHVLVCQSFLGHKHNRTLKVIDHFDNNKQNNSLNNLRIISNRDNVIKDRKKGITGENNIRMMKGKFQVRFEIDKKTKHFGCYATIEEAIFIRDGVVKKLQEDFKKHLS